MSSQGDPFQNLWKEADILEYSLDMSADCSGLGVLKTHTYTQQERRNCEGSERLLR